jgi:hypothetical protein
VCDGAIGKSRQSPLAATKSDCKRWDNTMIPAWTWGAAGPTSPQILRIVDPPTHIWPGL